MRMICKKPPKNVVNEIYFIESFKILEESTNDPLGKMERSNAPPSAYFSLINCRFEIKGRYLGVKLKKALSWRPIQKSVIFCYFLLIHW